ncbi:hypothetical protein J0895_03315 [Phormidium pseudopriestleyi FRX01]|uniref:Uncharacterized protein n=1 Tax=Phormidium pseudopriestleyi FRX01 TaxID=1759528 RepID=A0ABS3FM24_9CYAN|nr:hypothetical protein [Phormidium pseudopriestleyi]MBO0348145.1 hypothetical protein [Phormidium pseudopriestleyi FRX01]
MSNSVVLTETAKVPLKQMISLLESIESSNYSLFQDLEKAFIAKYGIEVWEEYFNFHLLPSLDDLSKTWLFQKMLEKI